jgi:very-short-patch-repair endonuclease
LVHVARSFEKTDTRRLDGLTVTCPARTLVDLAGVLERRRLEHALDRAVIEGLITLDGLERYIADRRLGCLRGVGALHRLIADRKELGIHRSGLERTFRDAIAGRRLPKARRQFRIGRYEVDFAYPKYKVAVEIDHVWTHGSAAALRADLERQNEIVMAGYLLLRFTEERIKGNGDQVALDVEQALRRRGWSPL